MVELNDLAGKVFSLLKGNGLAIKIFDQAGAETTDPNVGRRFFVMNPNIMVTIDEDSNTIEFSKGAKADDSTLSIQKNVRKLADKFLMNSKIKVFGRSIQPKDYAYQAKMNKGGTMMENSNDIHVGDRVVATVGRFDVISGIVKSVSGSNISILTPDRKLHNVDAYHVKPIHAKIKENDMKPMNHHLVGQVLNKVRYFGNSGHCFAATLADDLGVGLHEIQPVLNKLVKDGKITANPDSHGEVMYSVAVDEAVMEGLSKMFGSLRTSQQTLENVRILVRHKTNIDENIRGARSRHISTIFLECNGERFRFPHNYLPGARAMAQHLAHGGTPSDKVGSYIAESTEQLLKLRSFNRYITTNNLINEDSSGIVDTVKENIETLRTELKKLTGSKTYETIKARLETFQREPLAEDDISNLKELFTIRKFDEKFEEVLPIVKQLIQEKDTFHKRIEEAAGKIILLRRESINTTPIFEFASDFARLGFMISELASRIVENDELAGFINKIGNKLCKEGAVNGFERAVFSQILENVQIMEEKNANKKDIKESEDLEAYFDKYDYKFV
jgi:hypothetical protein